ncbi:hypothetical protein [Capnocytophaga sp.]|uniref:hypothetical protein n=1 Tax=Capnocytophaga sp. TaxID=44737 RepID=UPI0026DD4A1A|nr:hypothetical protein [Capnocytophaga sp.]MDO5105311.1 hypothetical protein [Capnocytophaga sp.]
MKRFFFTTALFITFFITYAQKFQNETGNITVLKGETQVNVAFNYTNLHLMKDNLTEEEYIADRIEYLNKKNQEEGDIWLTGWKTAKENIWQPNFLKLLDQTITKNKGISFNLNLNNAKYTLLVDVIWIYRGWDAGIVKQPAKVTTTLKIVETNNKSNVLYQIEAIEAPGNQFGSNFNDETRIGEGFAKTAKSFGKLMSKKLR